MTRDQLDSEISAEELAALHEMANLSDDALWAAAYEQTQPALEKRISELLT